MVKNQDQLQIEFNSWLAGFIDGEGTISIRKTNGIVSTCRLSIPNTHEKTIDYIHKRIGGRKQIRERNPSHKIIYHLKFVGKEAQEVILGIFPYLVTKKEQAILALRMIINPKNHQSARISLVEKRKRVGLFNKARRLNKRGR